MGADTKTKKRVIQDWQKAFPGLSIYAQNKLYKRLGPLITGIELIAMPNTPSYRPHFVMYKLWRNKMGKDIKACLASPFILFEYKNRRGFQFNVPYDKHDIFFELVESVKNQTPILFDQDIPFQQIFHLINTYSKTALLSASSNSYFQAWLYRTKFELALVLNSEQSQHISEQIKKINWSESHFMACGDTVEGWLKDLQEEKRNLLLNDIEINKENKKIKALNNSEILI